MRTGQAPRVLPELLPSKPVAENSGSGYENSCRKCLLSLEHFVSSRKKTTTRKAECRVFFLSGNICVSQTGGGTGHFLSLSWVWWDHVSLRLRSKPPLAAREPSCALELPGGGWKPRKWDGTGHLSCHHVLVLGHNDLLVLPHAAGVWMRARCCPAVPRMLLGSSPSISCGVNPMQLLSATAGRRWGANADRGDKSIWWLGVASSQNPGGGAAVSPFPRERGTSGETGNAPSLSCLNIASLNQK